MKNLGAALGWKFDHEPGLGTKGGELTAWPDALGAQPDAVGLAAIVAEYETVELPRLALEQAMAETDAGMVRVIEDLLAALVAKGVLTEADLDPKAMTKITARRAMRGG